MHLVTGQLGHGGVRVIVVLAGLLDLLLKRLLVFLRGGKTSGCGIGLVLSGGGILVGLCDLGLRGDNLVVGQIVQLKYLIRQVLAGTGQLLLEFGLALYRRGVLVLRIDQVGIGAWAGCAELNARPPTQAAAATSAASAGLITRTFVICE